MFERKRAHCARKGLSCVTRSAGEEVTEPRHLKVILPTHRGAGAPGKLPRPRSRPHGCCAETCPWTQLQDKLPGQVFRGPGDAALRVRPPRPGLRSRAHSGRSAAQLSAQSRAWESVLVGSRRECRHLSGLRNDFNPVGATPPLREAAQGPPAERTPSAHCAVSLRPRRPGAPGARPRRPQDGLSCSPGGANALKRHAPPSGCLAD